MKRLIVFYSRTGTTRTIAEELSKVLKCDIEELIDTKTRAGVLGYISSGRDAMKKTNTKLKPIKKNLEEYNQIIIGNPIWAWNLVPALRTFIEENKGIIKEKDIAYFYTAGNYFQKSIPMVQELIGKKSLANLGLTTKEVRQNRYMEKLEKFIKELG